MEQQVKPTLDDLVFEGRNKDYGAFFLRKVYPTHLKIALAIATAFFTIVIGGPFIYLKFIKDKAPVVKEKVVEVDLATVEIPPLDPSLPPPPPPPPVEKPKIKTVRHVPPKVVPDKEVVIEELPPTVDQIDSAAISNVTQEGEPDTLNLNEVVVENNTGLFGSGEEEQIFFGGVGVEAEFPGGQEALEDFIRKKMAPIHKKANRLGDKGKVVLKFVVEKDGSISQVTVVKGLAICSSCNDEAKEIIKNMPKWSPGLNNGKPVRLWKMQTISFDFED